VRKASASFFEKKEAKKLLLLGAFDRLLPTPAGPEIFCFCFLKKKRFLTYAFAVGQTGCFGPC
jgi:hypothetical protein